MKRCPCCAGQYTFQSYEAWNVPSLHPPPAEALKLLHSLAADRGIVAIMTQHRQETCLRPMQACMHFLGMLIPAGDVMSLNHRPCLAPEESFHACRWSVGKLSEMPPEGKVGVSPVCILGVNINSGQEISLRLRTDDLRGFRRYERIRETLVHELAHMVFSEHDNSFKELNSQLLREAAAQDWTRSARVLAGEAASFHADWKSSPANADSASMPASRRLGGALPVTADAQAAAAQAALDRAHAHAALAHTVPELQAVGLSEPPGDHEDSIEGLGHRDGSTEKLEDEMRRLGTPTAEEGSRPSPFTQDHCSGSDAPYSDGLKGSGSMETTQPNAAQDGSVNAADDSASLVEQAARGIVSAGTPSSAKAALDSVMKIIQVGMASHLPASVNAIRSHSSWTGFTWAGNECVSLCSISWTSLVKQSSGGCEKGRLNAEPASCCPTA